MLPIKEHEEEEPEAKAPLQRTRVGEGRHMGLVVEWKGHMGWIKPLSNVQHEQASRHRGLIYLNPTDVPEVDGRPGVMKLGKIVDFTVYSDDDGLGAEDCRGRSVLRMTVPHSEAKECLKDSPQWSEYLTDSEYYPAFEQGSGCLLRKYTWPLPFVLVELWGRDEELVSAAVSIAATGAPEGEAHLRLVVAAEDLDKVKAVLPADAEVSEKVVLSRPLPCHEVVLKASTDKCSEVARAILKLMEAQVAQA
eukprot:CAMPEP_0183387654 /NCGR_PEP_ID=MMETSP0370-20130417/3403_1 /TAXON_ID=268820 /ORGANISM="Peridinium aciculiferum, Strain PAER-2" /LENGTH=249 /DNA_ID=CAMNT_0025566325 /DNA_START=51 /DNA_END=800 /DNA_ORIENTATION=-